MSIATLSLLLNDNDIEKGEKVLTCRLDGAARTGNAKEHSYKIFYAFGESYSYPKEPKK